MPTYFITRTMTAYLTVDCRDEEEARLWSERIRATLEDENGTLIPPDAVVDFEADCHVADTTIEQLPDDETTRSTVGDKSP